jgi:hypothetical protein
MKPLELALDFPFTLLPWSCAKKRVCSGTGDGVGAWGFLLCNDDTINFF